ncbi:MAG TPA: proline dehydrogenase, partial [Candidatus Binatia bacterium]|nr:proline dehydrogenase [Candidatus Binatia bacterium]
MARWPAARRFVRRFVAGEHAEDALRVIAQLNAQGLLCAVTHLGENVVTVADATHAARAYVELLAEIERRRLAAVPSLKLTHLGLDLDEAVCRANLEAVLA